MHQLIEYPNAISSSRHTRKLEAILNNLVVTPKIETNAQSLARLVYWLQHPGFIQLAVNSNSTMFSPSAEARLWVLIQFIKKNPLLVEQLRTIVQSITSKMHAISLFCETGLSSKHGFLSELGNRLIVKILPAVESEKDFANYLSQLFPNLRNAAWLETISPTLVDELTSLLFTEKEDPLFHLLYDDIIDSINILAGRVCALGLQDDVRVRNPNCESSVKTSPFLNLPRICLKVTDLATQKLTAEVSNNEIKTCLLEYQNEVANCRKQIESVFEHLENYGVSVDLVFRLELIGKQINRIDLLVNHLLAAPGSDLSRQKIRLFTHLIREGIADRSTRALIQRNIHQLSRKIIQSAGAVGEHYITTTKAEYQKMLKSSAGGGILTSLTTIVKYLIISLPTLPLFFEGLLSSVNYAVSFLLIQGFGFTLATKQPAATAATLVGAMNQLHEEHKLSKLVEQIARTTRSQLAAVIGNICMAIPASLIMDFVWQIVFSHHFFDQEKSQHLLDTLNPFTSGTIVFAALTGILLWFSSIAGGWIENWVTYHRIADAVGVNPSLKKWVAPQYWEKIANIFHHHISGIGSNITLGILLGMTPILAKGFGLPIDIRHVTLSTCSLSFAGCGLGIEHILSLGFVSAIFGIIVIGIMNFSVSFVLALYIAGRACEVGFNDLLLLPKALLESFISSPRQFFLPPREDMDEALTKSS
ncbi:MAG: adventurous gliding motility protein AgmG [bacterium]|nr:MAG: adventurous gliding motility protein AgmG [bacterium]